MKPMLLRVILGLALAVSGVRGAQAQQSSGQATSSATSPAATTTSNAPDPVEVAADALVVRPVGIAATAIGAAVYLVALPFAAISGDAKRTGRALVGTPAKFTFKRRLGDFGGSAPL
ncbi:MAG: hypothetical protein JNK85_22330 [Verrucomicrobiales bacterium]|nr:hypothetical protein [Verrucomicrobiales bacterium]